MPRLHLLIAAQIATVDQFTNALSLTHIVEEMSVPHQLPPPKKGEVLAIHPGFAVASVWNRSKPNREETATGRIRILGPDKRALTGGEFTIHLTRRRLRNISRFPAFPYVGPGVYHIQAQVKSGRTWREVGKTSVVVKQAAAATRPEPSRDVVH